MPFSSNLEYMNDLLLFGKWVKANRARINLTERHDLYSHLNTNVIANGAITYLEFGVFEGASIRKWTEINTNPRSRFYGFDSFEGLPEDYSYFSNTARKGKFDTRGLVPNISDQRVKFIKGLFQETLPLFLTNCDTQNRLVINVDATLYSSTLYVLTVLHAFLVHGTLIMFDEFNAVNHEFKAFRNFVSAYRVNFTIISTCGPLYDRVAIEINRGLEM